MFIKNIIKNIIQFIIISNLYYFFLILILFQLKVLEYLSKNLIKTNQLLIDLIIFNL
jgi:hypothetical protein